MKNNWIRIAVAIVLFGLVGQRAHAAVSVSISMFQNDLDPYGQWVDVPRYGACWAPARVSSGWQPYTVGRWIYTDYGWTWVSDDPWGGIPYHYGTWVWTDGYGWVWIPGTVWAPAWVTWSYSDSYVGWAPISPSIEVGFSGYSGPPIVVSQNYYVFVPVNRFVNTNVSSIRIPAQQNATIFRQTRQRSTSFGVSNGILVNRGPSVQRIEQVSHTRISRENVSAAKVAARPVSDAGIRQGGRLAVTAPSSVRSREIHTAARGAGRESGPAGGETRSTGKTERAPRSNVQERQTSGEKTVSPRESHVAPKARSEENRTSHDRNVQHEQKAQEQRAPQGQKAQQEQKVQRESRAPVQERRATHEPKSPPPPPSHETRRESPPPTTRELHREPPPPPPPHEASPDGSRRAAPPPSARERQAPPPGRSREPQSRKKDEPPPPTPH